MFFLKKKINKESVNSDKYLKFKLKTLKTHFKQVYWHITVHAHLHV